MRKGNTGLTDEQAAAMESLLSTDTDALVSSILTNENPAQYQSQLKAFIAKKNADISLMCSEHSKTFSMSIKGAQNLGVDALKLKDQVNYLRQQIENDIKDYESTLEHATKLRADIAVIDSKLTALSECEILMQRLQNINEQIEKKNYYVAVLRILDFADYDSKIATCSAIQGLQSDIEPIMRYIKHLAEERMRAWILLFNEKCEKIGSSFLYGTEAPPLELNSIYEYYMIERQLGELQSFKELYVKERKSSLYQLIQPIQVHIGDFNQNIQKLFSCVAGFFVTETRISSDGFNLFSQSELNEFWVKITDFLTSSLIINKTRLHLQDLLALSNKINWFADKMDTYCNLSSGCLRDILMKTGFKQQFNSEGSREICDIIDKNSQETMTIKSPEEFKQIQKYSLADPPSEFPIEMPFVPAIPLVCELLENYVVKFSKFSAATNDQNLIEAYEALMSASIKKLEKLGTDFTAIPTCGFMIASLNSLMKSLPYFEKFIQNISQSSIKPNEDSLKKKFYAAIDNISSHLKELFDNFMLQILDVHCIKVMETGTGPHNFSQELLTFLTAMADVLKPVMTPDSFKVVIENIAITLSSQLSKLFAESQGVKWTPDLISNASVNVSFIINWSTLISVPSAKQKLNGVDTMLKLLLNNQLMAITSEPTFKDKNKDIPFDSMVNILMNYSSKTKKSLYVIPSNLVKSLIQKFLPYCQHPEKLQTRRRR